jgi:8-oxo-dGTP diphosphatase
MVNANLSGIDINQLEIQATKDGVQKKVGGAVVLLEEGILLLERTPDEFMAGLVELPSGNIDQGEDILTGLVREIKEETGLETETVEGYIGSFDYTSGSGKKARQFNFIVRTRPGKIKLSPDEHSRYFIVEPHTPEYDALNISKETHKVILKAFE